MSDIFEVINNKTGAPFLRANAETVKKHINAQLENLLGFTFVLDHKVLSEGGLLLRLPPDSDVYLTETALNELKSKGLYVGRPATTTAAITRLLDIKIYNVTRNVYNNMKAKEDNYMSNKEEVYNNGLNLINNMLADSALVNDLNRVFGGTASAILQAFVDVAEQHIPNGTTLDKPLLTEIGKAYRSQYDMHAAAGDEKKQAEVRGSMLAVKRIMDLLSQ